MSNKWIRRMKNALGIKDKCPVCGKPLPAPVPGRPPSRPPICCSIACLEVALNDPKWKQFA